MDRFTGRPYDPQRPRDRRYDFCDFCTHERRDHTFLDRQSFCNVEEWTTAYGTLGMSDDQRLETCPCAGYTQAAVVIATCAKAVAA